jgi:hypothetical protein
MLPSFYVSGDKARDWSVTRAAALGAGVGLVAALFKILGPLHGALGVGGLAVSIAEIAGAVVGFAALCAGASALRNIIARRLIWPDL